MSRVEVIGDGMIGRACRLCFPDDPYITFYAAGVSNSSAVDVRDFQRERERLEASIQPGRTLIYFGTTSASGQDTDLPYVAHKLAMEQLVQATPSWLILRLPNVAGRTSNPHTLLNFLYARISRSERFVLQSMARRNIIDVGDVARIAEWLLNSGARNEIVNVATPWDYTMRVIVAEFEYLAGKKAVMDISDSGTAQTIDTARIAGFEFGRNYLRRTLTRYYG